jgi:lipopolysaccharide biosynthesis glycosyltransferase
MDVFFATNTAYAPHLAAAMLSLLENNPSQELAIHVISFDLALQDQVKLRKLCVEYNKPIIFHIVNSAIFDDLKVNNHFSRENYLRLMIPELTDSTVCLYLDSDLLVRSSLAALISIDLGDNYVAAVDTPGFKRHSSLGMDKCSRYFNSGVMLINLQKWRADKVSERTIDFVERHPSAVEYVDQCGLNAVINGRWLSVSGTFNTQTPELRTMKEVELGQVVVAHFTGTSKPWQLEYDGPLRREYWNCRSRAGYPAIISDNFSIRGIARVFRKRLLRVF